MSDTTEDKSAKQRLCIESGCAYKAEDGYARCRSCEAKSRNVAVRVIASERERDKRAIVKSGARIGW
jgi:hypothetical protein